MENKNKTKNDFLAYLQIILLTIGMFLLAGFTIYVQQPEDVEINQITYAGREIINNNNKYAFDLLAWAPGYTDQAIIQIKNNSQDDLNWNIVLENLDNVENELLNSIDVYIKENPTRNDVLEMYNSPITDGYKYVGRLSEIKNSKLINGVLNPQNKSIELSILLHVSEDSNIQETKFDFRNILKINTISNNNTVNKIFE